MAGDVNVNPESSSLLIELVKGQQAAATEMRLQNARLFGGDGQPGAIKYILDQHKELAEKLDANKHELFTKIELVKTDIGDRMVSQKKDIDSDIKEVRDAGLDTDRKASRAITIGATVNAVFLGALAFLGVYHRGH